MPVPVQRRDGGSRRWAVVLTGIERSILLKATSLVGIDREACRALVMSMTWTMTSACSMARRARCTPSRSTRSWVSRRPAVSVMRKGMPCRLANSSMVSRVVPGVGLTMARSKPSRRLSRLDFPALGSPQRTRRTPSRRMRPSRRGVRGDGRCR